MSRKVVYDACDLDAGVDHRIDEELFTGWTDVNEWTLNDGVSSKGIKMLCEHYDISMYAYDLIINAS